jgi:hypothetical protein
VSLALALNSSALPATVYGGNVGKKDDHINYGWQWIFTKYFIIVTIPTGPDPNPPPPPPDDPSLA